MLSETKLRSAKVKARPYKLTDGARLYVLVTPAGAKLWKWNYEYKGKQKTMAFGAYPSVSPSDARLKRDQARALLEEGRDPMVDKRLRIEANLKDADNTFERVARAWHATVKDQWAIRHAHDVLRSLERDIFPKLGQLPIKEIKTPLVFQVLKAIETRDARETAKRIRQRISAVYIYAIAQGIAEADPAEKLATALKPPRKGRQPAITSLVLLRQMIDDAERDYARPVTRLALRLLALTAVRPNELRGATWREFEGLNGPQPLWRIPATRMKGDIERKSAAGADHLVPLARQSVEVLRALWTLTGKGELLFPNTRHAHRPMSENAIGYLLNRAGYHGHHVPHGFRAAFSTIMNEWAVEKGGSSDRQIIDLMLAHVSKDKVEAAYNRAAHMQRRRDLAQIWADKLTSDLPPACALTRRPARKNATHDPWSKTS